MNYADASHHINSVNGFMGSLAQREFMFNLAKTTDKAAEIGSFKGLSAAIVAMGMNSVTKDKNPEYYCIDTFEASNEELNSEATLDKFIRATQPIDRNKSIKIVKGWSTAPETLAQIPFELDWVYIDGDHSTEGVIADIRAYTPHVKQEGLVLFHDHTWDSVRAGVNHFVEKENSIRLVSYFDDFGIYKKI